MVNKVAPVLICFFFAVLAGFALLHPGLPPTHDGEYHVIRFYEFDKVLRSGVLYPRWAPDLNNGYGIPLFNFVYPLPNYIASIAHASGFSFIDAFKINLFLATVLGGIFISLWSQRYWGVQGGIISSVFYSFAPYRFVDVYIRGSVGEVWALALFPAFLWAYDRSLEDRKFIPVAALLLGLTVFSHNILAVMFFSFSIIYMSYKIFGEKKRKHATINGVLILVLGLSLSMVFWLPALVEKKYTVGLQVFEVYRNFPELYQLLIPSWGSGFSGGGSQNEMSYQIGAANLLIIFLAGAVLVALRRRKDKNFRLVSLFFLSFFFLFFLMLRISAPLWEAIPIMYYFQFPWRFLSLVILVCSFLAGSIFYVWKKNIVTISLIFFAVLTTYAYAKPAYYHDRSDEYYISKSNFIDGTNSPGNAFNTIWFNPALSKAEKKIVSTGGEYFRIEKEVITPQSYSFQVVADQNTRVLVNTAYFPGWQVSVDGKKTPLREEKGLIGFIIPKGTHSVAVRFVDTIVRQISSTVSLGAILGTGFLFYWNNRKRQKV